MNILPFLFLPMLLPNHSFAQVADSSRQAIGFLGEANSMFGGNDNAIVSTVGLQYNKWYKKNVSYKIIAGYGNYNHSPRGITQAIDQDTAIRKAANTKIDMAVIGGGIEVQRQFYKKLYFFAGFEIRVGYGSGTIDTTVTSEYYAPQINPYTGATVQGIATSSFDKSGTTATMFYFGLTPYFGLKLEFRKFCLGTEFKNYIYHTSVHYNSNREGLTDFDLSNISQSIFVQYKF